MADRKPLIGMMLVGSAASIGGLTVVLTRFVVAESDPFTLASFRYILASLVLIAVVKFQGRKLRIDPRDRIALLVLSVMFYGAFPFCFARALQDTTSARGALIYACMPLVTMTLAAFFRVERITSWKFFAVVLAIAGVWSAIGFDVASPPNAIRGDVIMAIGTACSAAYTVFAKKYVIKYDPIAMTAYSMMIGALALAPVAFIFGRPLDGSLDLSTAGWLGFAGLVLPGGVLMMWFFITGFRLVTPTQAAISVGFNPLTAILLAAWILGEPIGWGSAVGYVLIMAAVFCANRKSSSRAS